MPLETNRHPEEEVIEKYSMGDLTEEESAKFEEHLLICEFCQNRVAESDTYVSTMQTASARIRQDGLKAENRRWHFPQWVPVSAALMAALVLSAVGLEWSARRNANPGNTEPYAVNLVATRGSGIEAKAPAGRALALQLDLAGLPPEASYRLQLVDGNGTPVWDGAVSSQTSQGVALVPRMSRGLYFLRAYASSAKLLREYGLEVEDR